ncbi:MAG: penicillin-binding protein activator LpoB [Planctomycetes bacterium]|nr:penicillin-binding protein activator LpoB [Planctomycetota bacterium]
MRITFLALLISLAFLSGCTSVKRVEPGETIDLSGEWNDTDSQQVAEEMIKDSVDRAWIAEYKGEFKRKPVVIVGHVKNNTGDHINTEPFTKELERAFINSGKLKVVAGVGERPQLRQEVIQMSNNVRPETLKQIRRETGADFMLMGVVNDIVDKVGGKSVRFYQINLELIALESHEKVWIGQKKIKKFVKKGMFVF